MKSTITSFAADEWILESQRLRYRKINEGDFEELKAMLSDPKVMYAWEHTFSDQLISNWIKNQLSYYRQDGVGYFAAIEKDSSAFVGQMGLHRFSRDNQIAFEVCYMLKNQYQHNGYALEGVQALTEYAFANMGLGIVYAQIKTDNITSIKVAEKARFIKQSVFIKHYNGKDMEHSLYAKTL
ncbi:GNAT family N-acetyltransferase [Desulfosporosinus sp. PR]|uniref:GNAT family N-acetyltransferase n=1 Tax=Candidatus Desulfosporosinus nitrosoreducens TaxID=3401928 RepID=UPI0027F9B2CD|nr:GNAT family N-acetyltransferase [Desulfosporosinus sp. PR]MDQ7094390.1 GNAT family N-acetyltransferase [Desulfosporosinus sp. PR]